MYSFTAVTTLSARVSSLLHWNERRANHHIIIHLFSYQDTWHVQGGSNMTGTDFFL